MKKVLSLLICVVLLLSFIGVADAAGEKTITGEEYSVNPSTSENLQVSLTISDSFVVTIPVDFTLGSAANQYTHQAVLSAQVTTLQADKNITVYISSTNYSDKSWHIVLDDNDDSTHDSMKYGIKLGNSHITGPEDTGLIASGSAVLSVNSDENDKSVNMHFKLLDNLAGTTGTYKDTITFTVQMTDNVVDPTYINST